MIEVQYTLRTFAHKKKPKWQDGTLTVDDESAPIGWTLVTLKSEGGGVVTTTTVSEKECETELAITTRPPALVGGFLVRRVSKSRRQRHKSSGFLIGLPLLEQEDTTQSGLSASSSDER